MTTKRLYIAYGSNLHRSQMAYRCPDATVEGTSSIPDYTLLFRGSGVATIEPKEGDSVPIVVWNISKRDEQRLDIYEDFPVDTKGVSGAHCEIRKTASGFEILDLGSSYGTTLGSGQKLMPNVPVFIPSGTYFMVGGAEQLFQIRY